MEELLIADCPGIKWMGNFLGVGRHRPLWAVLPGQVIPGGIRKVALPWML